MLRATSMLAAGMALVMLQPGTARAVTLGELNVQSALGQPLSGTTVARIGPGETINSNCVSVLPNSAGDLNSPKDLTITTRAANTPGAYPVEIRSAKPLYEPMYEFRLQISCPGTVALSKTYTIMLNLPMAASQTMVTDSAPAQANPASTRPATKTRRSVAPRVSGSNRSRALANSSDRIPAGSAYRVRSGDSLSTIAARIDGRLPDSTWQVAELLFQSNPDAFIRNNPDKIKLGVVLDIPDVATLTGVTPSPARPVVMELSSPSAPTPNSEMATPVVAGRPENSPAFNDRVAGDDMTAGQLAVLAADSVQPFVGPNLFELTDADSNVDPFADGEMNPFAADDSFAQDEPFAQNATDATNFGEAQNSQFADNGSQATPPAELAAVPPVSSGVHPLISVAAGILIGLLLSLALLGRSMLRPWIDGRERRKFAQKQEEDFAPAAEIESEPLPERDPMATLFDEAPAPVAAAVEIGSATTQYKRGGIDVEFSEAEEEPAVDLDLSDASFDSTDIPTVENPAPRVSLRDSANRDNSKGDYDSMLDSLDESPSVTLRGSKKPAPMQADTGTMRSLFEDPDMAVTAELNSADNAPTVEMANAVKSGNTATVEMPNAANADNQETRDDLHSLHSLQSPDDEMAATLTQALKLLERDYEDELTASQVLEKKDVDRLVSRGKK